MNTAINIIETKTVALSDIEVPEKRLRSAKKKDVSDLAASLLRDGQLVPIIVAPNVDGAERPYVLVAGMHRLLAATEAGWDGLSASITSDEVSDADLEVVEIIENLKRVELTEPQRAKQIGRLAKIRAAQDKEAAAEKAAEIEAQIAEITSSIDGLDDPARVKEGKARIKELKAEKKAAASAANASSKGYRALAKETGMSKSGVAALGKAHEVLGDEGLDAIEGTSLAAGTEMTALADVAAKDKGKAKALIEDAKAGKKVSAKAAKKELDAGSEDAVTAADIRTEAKALKKKMAGWAKEIKALIKKSPNAVAVNEALDALEEMSVDVNNVYQSVAGAQNVERNKG